MNTIRTHMDVALYCLTHLRQKGNDGSDNLLFIGLLSQALTAGHCTLADLPGIVATPLEMKKHEKKGYLASARRILGILRSGESRYNTVLVEHLFEDLKKAEATLTDIKSSLDELTLYT